MKLSHQGKRTFVRYVYRAAEVLDQPLIRRQVRSHWSRLVRGVNQPLPTKK
jgi:hypothetical protein